MYLVIGLNTDPVFLFIINRKIVLKTLILPCWAPEATFIWVSLLGGSPNISTFIWVSSLSTAKKNTALLEALWTTPVAWREAASMLIFISVPCEWTALWQVKPWQFPPNDKMRKCFSWILELAVLKERVSQNKVSTLLLSLSPLSLLLSLPWDSAALSKLCLILPVKLYTWKCRWNIDVKLLSLNPQILCVWKLLEFVWAERWQRTACCLFLCILYSKHRRALS